MLINGGYKLVGGNFKQRKIMVQILAMEIFKSLIPVALMIFGGQYLLDKYAINKKRKETEIELLKRTREEKYTILHQFYNLFGEFMRLYRIINSNFYDLNDIETQKKLFDEVILAETKVDALILKIGCEFIDENDSQENVESMLGALRQSVQIWREKVSNKEKLPFNRSSQDDYLKFKTTFAFTCGYMINKIYGRLEAQNVEMKRVEGILVGAFDNKHEKWNVDALLNKQDFKKYYSSKPDNE